MKLANGQRWKWDGNQHCYLVEITRAEYKLAKLIQKYRGVEYLTVGETLSVTIGDHGVGGIWTYLEGQDKPA